MKLYRVCFVTKKGGFCRWSVDVAAGNATKAKEEARGLWRQCNGHMFSIEAKRIPAEDVQYLKPTPI